MVGWFRRRRKRDIDLTVCSAGHRWNARDRKIGQQCGAEYRTIHRFDTNGAPLWDDHVCAAFIYRHAPTAFDGVTLNEGKATK